MTVRSSAAELIYPFADTPEPGTPSPVAPGVLWLRMPLPFALDHINLWVLEDGDGWTIVDTGIRTDAVMAVWRELLSGPFAGRPIKKLLVTHFHPDHAGLGQWLVDETGAELWVTRIEWLMNRMLYFDAEGTSAAAQVALFREHGLDESWLAALAERGNTYRDVVLPLPPRFRRMQAGDAIPVGAGAWQVIVGEGHAPEHACLYGAAAGALISGDIVLPRITPNVSLWASESDGDPLGRYLDSLERLRPLPADVLVLPSHGRPFRGLHRRIDDLIAHHDERLELLADACAAPATAAELLPVMFSRPLSDPHQVMFAMGETLAHLVRLEVQGVLARHQGDDGAWRFRKL